MINSKLQCKIVISILFSFLVFTNCYADGAEQFSVSGYIKDKSSGEALIGCSIFIKEIQKSTSTNNYGFYSLTLEKGTYSFSITYIGYNNYESIITLDHNQTLNVDFISK